VKTNHYVTIGMLIGALAFMVGGLHDWSEALKPQFVAGALGAIGAVLKGIHEDKPEGKAKEAQ
jgi:hypothetical protein